MIHLITGNINKLAEVKTILPNIEINQINIDLAEIQEIDPQKIIEAKLNEAKKHYDGEFIVEDTSLYLEAFDYKLPGPFIKWFLKTIGNEGMAELAYKLGKTGAKAVNWLGYYDKNNQIHFFKGEIEGTITKPAKEGFGWDPIFIPKGSSESFAEMTSKEKNMISHRKQALEELKKHLKNHENN